MRIGVSVMVGYWSLEVSVRRTVSCTLTIAECDNVNRKAIHSRSQNGVPQTNFIRLRRPILPQANECLESATDNTSHVGCLACHRTSKSQRPSVLSSAIRRCRMRGSQSMICPPPPQQASCQLASNCAHNLQHCMHEPHDLKLHMLQRTAWDG